MIDVHLPLFISPQMPSTLQNLDCEGKKKEHKGKLGSAENRSREMPGNKDSENIDWRDPTGILHVDEILLWLSYLNLKHRTSSLWNQDNIWRLVSTPETYWILRRENYVSRLCINRWSQGGLVEGRKKQELKCPPPKLTETRSSNHCVLVPSERWTIWEFKRYCWDFSSSPRSFDV